MSPTEPPSCWYSGDNVLQMPGEALVRNNAPFGGSISFHSGDHQGSTRDLVVVHDSFFNDGLCVNLASWGGRAGMVFSNNAAYSQAGTAIQLCSDSSSPHVQRQLRRPAPRVWSEED